MRLKILTPVCVPMRYLCFQSKKAQVISGPQDHPGFWRQFIYITNQV